MNNPLSVVEPWNLVTPGYIAFNVPVFEKWARDTFERIALHPKDIMLDIACGPGTVALLAAPLVTRVAALDFSPNMIDALLHAVFVRQIRNVEAAVCDCQSLPFDNGTFDVVVSQFGLMFFPDRLKGMKEAFRVMKKGGRIAISSWAPIARSEAMSLMMGAMNAGFAKQMKKRTGSQDIVKGLDDKDTFMSEMNASGFKKIQLEEIAHSFPCGAPEEFWRDMVESSAPLVLLRSSMPQSEWANSEFLALEYIRTHLNGRNKLYSTAYLVTGIRAT